VSTLCEFLTKFLELFRGARGILRVKSILPEHFIVDEEAHDINEVGNRV